MAAEPPHKTSRQIGGWNGILGTEITGKYWVSDSKYSNKHSLAQKTKQNDQNGYGSLLPSSSNMFKLNMSCWSISISRSLQQIRTPIQVGKDIKKSKTTRYPPPGLMPDQTYVGLLTWWYPKIIQKTINNQNPWVWGPLITHQKKHTNVPKSYQKNQKNSSPANSWMVNSGHIYITIIPQNKLKIWGNGWAVLQCSFQLLSGIGGVLRHLQFGTLLHGRLGQVGDEPRIFSGVNRGREWLSNHSISDFDVSKMGSS